MSSEGNKTPEPLRPFVSLGVDLRAGVGDGMDWHGDCLFCGKSNHFYASPKTGKWDCKVCGESGNAITFLSKLHASALAATTRQQYLKLSEHRGIPTGVLRAAGLAWHDDGWVIPCRSDQGTIRDLRRYDGKKLMSTAGCKAQLWNADRLAAATEGSTVWLLEGEWDGVAMEWLLRDAGDAGVPVAVPGAMTFKTEWVELFRGKKVVTVFDLDHTGDRGQIKAHAALSSVVESIEHVCWPETMPEGWDTRDFVRDTIPRVGAGKTLEELKSLCRATPRREVGDGSDEHPGESASGKLDESTLPDSGFADVIVAFRRHLDIDAEFELAIKVCLAVCLSNDVRDDPVWIYLMGPASAGKTELLTSMQGSKRCVFTSKVTPNSLVSGWRGEGANDPSLIPRLKGKTLIAKDFTEILSMVEPAQKEIYSTLRGAFDGYVDKVFGNGMERKYRNCSFTIIAGVTHAILKHRENAMGERFLKFRLSRPTQEAQRHRTRMAMRSVGLKGERDVELQRVVAGFLKKKLPSMREMPAVTGSVEDSIIDAACLVAGMRTQVERDQRSFDPSYAPEPEAPIRVAKQLTVLARVLAWIDGAHEVGPQQMAAISKVALDTVCGFDLDIVEAIMHMGGTATRKDITEACGIPSSTVSRRVEDLVMTSMLKKLEGSDAPGRSGGRPPATYMVREDIQSLWKQARKDMTWSKDTQQSSRSGQAASDSSRSSSVSTTPPDRSGSRTRLVRRQSARTAST